MFTPFSKQTVLWLTPLPKAPTSAGSALDGRLRRTGSPKPGAGVFSSSTIVAASSGRIGVATQIASSSLVPRSRVMNQRVLSQIGMWWTESMINGRSPRSLSVLARANHQRDALRRFFGHECSGCSGVTMVELLCVLVIIAILASLLLPAVFRAYNRAKGMAEEIEAPQIAHLLLGETRNYCTAHPQYNFGSKSDFTDKCGLAPKCRDWVQSSTTEFIPFSYLDPTNRIVLAVHIGRNQATLYAFSKGELSTRQDGN
jgi:prepilin-type N-terminal cleavage/methylation domain-containing protein